MVGVLTHWKKIHSIRTTSTEIRISCLRAVDAFKLGNGIDGYIQKVYLSVINALRSRHFTVSKLLAENLNKLVNLILVRFSLRNKYPSKVSRGCELDKSSFILQVCEVRTSKPLARLLP